jgi:mRNA-degrading endonuclease toxin of MazEF toxin-antitoxin module
LSYHFKNQRLFEVLVAGQKIGGTVLADQVESFDWTLRKAKFIEQAEAPAFNEVIGKLNAILGLRSCNYSV